MNTEIKRVMVCDLSLVSVHGDITEEHVDAVVNAANEQLIHGGGVAGAIVRKGGPKIQEESRRIAPVPTGSAKSTGAGALPCKHVIHAVGPVWKGGEYGEREALALAVRSALQVAVELGCSTISMPALSCGIFGFPVEEASGIILQSVLEFAREGRTGTLKEIRFCNIEEKVAHIFAAQLDTVVKRP